MEVANNDILQHFGNYFEKKIDISKDPDYQKYFTERKDIFEEIESLLKKKNGLTFEKIAIKLNVEKRFLIYTLNTWLLYPCTFFDNGKIKYNPNNKKWFIFN